MGRPRAPERANSLGGFLGFHVVPRSGGEAKNPGPHLASPGATVEPAAARNSDVSKKPLNSKKTGKPPAAKAQKEAGANDPATACPRGPNPKAPEMASSKGGGAERGKRSPVRKGPARNSTNAGERQSTAAAAASAAFGRTSAITRFLSSIEEAMTLPSKSVSACKSTASGAASTSTSRVPSRTSARAAASAKPAAVAEEAPWPAAGWGSSLSRDPRVRRMRSNTEWMIAPQGATEKVCKVKSSTPMAPKSIPSCKSAMAPIASRFKFPKDALDPGLCSPKATGTPIRPVTKVASARGQRKQERHASGKKGVAEAPCEALELDLLAQGVAEQLSAARSKLLPPLSRATALSAASEFKGHGPEGSRQLWLQSGSMGRDSASLPRMPELVPENLEGEGWGGGGVRGEVDYTSEARGQKGKKEVLDLAEVASEGESGDALGKGDRKRKKKKKMKAVKGMVRGEVDSSPVVPTPPASLSYRAGHAVPRSFTCELADFRFVGGQGYSAADEAKALPGAHLGLDDSVPANPALSLTISGDSSIGLDIMGLEGKASTSSGGTGGGDDGEGADVLAEVGVALRNRGNGEQFPLKVAEDMGEGMDEEVQCETGEPRRVLRIKTEGADLEGVQASLEPDAWPLSQEKSINGCIGAFDPGSLIPIAFGKGKGSGRVKNQGGEENSSKHRSKESFNQMLQGLWEPWGSGLGAKEEGCHGAPRERMLKTGGMSQGTAFGKPRLGLLPFHAANRAARKNEQLPRPRIQRTVTTSFLDYGGHQTLVPITQPAAKGSVESATSALLSPPRCPELPLNTSHLFPHLPHCPGSEINKVHRTVSISCTRSHTSLPRLGQVSMSWAGLRPPRSASCFRDEYQLGRVLGRGSYGVVRHCLHLKTGQKLACKVVSKIDLAGPKDVERVRMEFVIQKRLAGHKHIVRMEEFFEDAENIFLVMELCPGGDFFDMMKELGLLTEEDARELFWQILKAVEFCQDHRVLHRDIKLENIMVSASQRVETCLPDPISGRRVRKMPVLKLGDFGASLVLPPEEKTFGRTGGSLMYQAPEVLSRDKYDHKADMWSLGIVLFAMLSSSFPFSAPADSLLVGMIRRGVYRMSGPKWEHISVEARDVVKSLLQKDPALRASVMEVKASAWFQEPKLCRRRAL